jgi:hypothetical protein
MSYAGTIVFSYRLVRQLGEGGFGTVYLAEHTELGRRSACKILHREYATKPEVVDRFFREAKAVCAIGHRAIIEIENFGRLPTGEPFYLMEYFPGQALADRVARAPLSADEAIAVFEPVASALAAAHAKQIIHRDLKPENIMVLEDERRIVDVKLLDFGIAKLAGESDAVRSRSGVAMGTPAFMSPEQARDAKAVDARSDVYSFAATIYAAFAGRPPFVSNSVAGTLIKVQTEPPEPLVRHAPTAPVVLQDALERCMSKQPDDRPATIGDAWGEIQMALRGHAVVAATLPPDAPTIAPLMPRVPLAPSTTSTLGSAAAQSTMNRERPARWPWAVGGLGIIAAAVVVWQVRPESDDEGNRVTTTSDPVEAIAPVEPPAGDALAPVVPPASAGPLVTGAIDGEPVAFAHGRLKLQAEHDKPHEWVLQLSTVPATCDGDFVPAPSLLVLFTDRELSRPRRFSWNTETTTIMARGGTLELVRTGDRARGTLESSASAGTTARGAFDVAVCPTDVIEGAPTAKPTLPTKPKPAPKPKQPHKVDPGSPSVTPPAVLEPPKESPRPDPPRTDCSVASFARVYNQAQPPSDQIDAALARLKRCRPELDSDVYQRVQQNLMSKKLQGS